MQVKYLKKLWRFHLKPGLLWQITCGTALIRKWTQTLKKLGARKLGGASLIWIPIR